MTSSIDEGFLTRHTLVHQLPSGLPIKVRPIIPEDKQLLVEGFERLSPESRYRRFMSGISRLTKQQLIYLTELDYVDHFAVAAFAIDEPGQPGIGVARYVRVIDEPEVAEAAVAVIDDYQSMGIGSLLLQILGAVALSNGIKSFRGYLLSDNRPARDLVEGIGASTGVVDGGLTKADVDLTGMLDNLAKSPLYAVLRSAADGEGLNFLGGDPPTSSAPS